MPVALVNCYLSKQQNFVHVLFCLIIFVWLPQINNFYRCINSSFAVGKVSQSWLLKQLARAEFLKKKKKRSGFV